jgi:hypothetical protein
VTYTSSSGATPHANPIILDSAGRVPSGQIWLTDGLNYKFVIETSTGILLGTYDNINSTDAVSFSILAAPSGATLVGSDDDAGGALYSNVAEAITYLRTRPTVSNDYFGITPGLGDNTAGFADMAEFIRTSSLTDRLEVIFEPGTFYTDKIELKLQAQNPGANRGSLSIQGTGGGNATQFYANDTDEAVFFGVECESAIGVEIEGISLWGQGLTNPGQDPFAMWTNVSDAVGPGDMSFGRIRLRSWDFDGSMWFRGSQLTGGVGDIGNQSPIQHLTLDNCDINARARATHKPQLIMMGQCGQIDINNGSYDGFSRTGHMGPVVALGVDWRLQRIQPVTESTTDDTWELGSGVEIICPSMTPVRLIGTNFPVTSPQIAKGTTYYLHKSALLLASNRLNRIFKLATSGSNAAAGTFIDITGTGTPADYSFVQIWATALSGNEFSTQDAHRLCKGDQLQLVGSNLPTPLATGTTYFVIRTGYRTFKLATSLANARAGIAIAATGGTLADFGFVVFDGNVASVNLMGKPYSIRGNLMTVQSAEMGIHLANCGDMDLNLHCEQLKISVHGQAGTTGNVKGSIDNRGAYTGDGQGTFVLTSGQGTVMRVRDGMQQTDLDVTELTGYAIAPSILQTANVVTNGPNTTGARSFGVTQQITPAATTVIGGATEFFLNIPNLTPIANFDSVHPGGTEIVARCLSGGTEAVEFISSGNISISGVQRMQLQRNTAATFRRFDFGSSWTLAGASPFGTYFYQGISWVANAITPTPAAGNLHTTAMTGNSTLNAPAVTPILGLRWSVWLLQDGTGGRTITWNAAYKGVTLAASGTANQKAIVDFVWDGTAFVQTNSTGWYS